MSLFEMINMGFCLALFIGGLYIVHWFVRSTDRQVMEMERRIHRDLPPLIIGQIFASEEFTRLRRGFAEMSGELELLKKRFEVHIEKEGTIGRPPAGREAGKVIR